MLAWTQPGIDVAESSADPSARYWLGPLLNNLGWEHFEAGEYADALRAFERALTERERDPANRSAIEIARYAVAKTLRALGRSSEAVPLLEQSVAWAESEDAPDGWFHEELAETYADLGRTAEAADQARKALALLPEADPTFVDGEQATRLRQLAAADLQGDVAVLSLRLRLALRQRRLERRDQHRPRAPRLDHVVDVAALGRRVRVGEALLVVRDQLGSPRVGVVRPPRAPCERRC